MPPNSLITNVLFCVFVQEESEEVHAVRVPTGLNTEQVKTGLAPLDSYLLFHQFQLKIVKKISSHARHLTPTLTQVRTTRCAANQAKRLTAATGSSS